MEILGYLLATVIGISLGLIGGGGSILTVPVLVYVFGIDPILATAYSLFIVGITSLGGAVLKIKEGLVSIKTAVVFAIPAFIAVYLTRLLLVPAIPDVIFSSESFTLTKQLAMMLFFALIMGIAAISMMRSKKQNKDPEAEIKFNYPLIFVEAIVVGVVTGLVGAGGGFLIIPALVLLAKLPMKLAVGTSLTIISVKSLIGFIGDVQGGQSIDWVFLMSFSALALVGIFIGNYLTKFIPGAKLKKGFGWFVLVMAVYILWKELI